MIQRKAILLTISMCLAAASTSSIQADEKLVAERLTKLNWLNEIIQTQPTVGHQQAPVVTGISTQPKGDLLAIVGDDHTVSLYDKEKRAFVKQLVGHEDWVRTVQFSPDGKFLATAGNDRTIKIWTVETFRSAKPKPKTLDSLQHAIAKIQYSPDGKLLAAVGFDRTLRIYDIEKRIQIHSLKCSSADNHAVAFSADGKKIAAGGRDGNIRVWQISDSTQVAEFRHHTRRIRAIAFQGNDIVISCGDDCLVNQTNISKPEATVKLARHGGKLYDIHLLNPTTLATAGSDNAIYIWNLEDQSQIGVLKGHIGTVSCLASAEGTLVSGSYDTRIRLWSFERNASIPAQPKFSSPRLGGQNTAPASWEPVIK